jgi:hypothetical protein
MAAAAVMASVHPGEILLEEFLKPLAVSPAAGVLPGLMPGAVCREWPCW